jgi:FAD synthetase
MATRIMVFGTFDVVHPGHRNFFQQARALAREPYLIVSVARDKNVARIKGKAPRHGEKVRVAALKKISIIDKVIMGSMEDHLPHIVKQKPDIIALGHDQTAYVRGLRSALKAAGLKTKIVRLKPFRRDKYKSSLYTK